jgi:hypothetical protein
MMPGWATPNVQAYVPQQYYPQPTQWQAQPQYAQQPRPITARGVSGPTTAPQPARYALPSPQSLGVSAKLNLESPPPQRTEQVDWTAIQSRIAKLKVISYDKKASANGVFVKLVLPTADPRVGQPVEAQAHSEGAALIMALDFAEAWAAKK